MGKLRLLICLLALLALGAQGHRTARQQRGGIFFIDQGWSNSKSTSFDGIDEVVRIPDEDALECDDEDELTVCLWVNQNTAAANQAPVSKIDATTGALENTWSVVSSNISGATYRFQFYTNGGACNAGTSDLQVGTTNALTAGTWHYVCFWFDYDAVGGNRDKQRIYVDNVNRTASDTGAAAELNDCATDFTVGGRDPDSTNRMDWDGLVDEVVMYCDALSEADMTALYNGGTPIDPATVNDSYRVYLRMGDAPDSASTFNNAGTAGNGIGTNLEAADLVTNVP